MKQFITPLLVFSLIILMGATTPLKTDDDKGFKNLKVLPKDITEQALDSVMGHFAISLGVKCNFCHARPDSTSRHLDFASDLKKEKDIARSMMKMTSYINSNFFNFEKSNQTDTIHEVVCYSCHRGSKAPDAKDFLAIIDSTQKAMEAQRRQQPVPGK